MTRTLFDISNDIVLLRLYAATEDHDPHHDSEVVEENKVLEDWLNHLHEEEATKLDGYCAVLNQLDMEEAACQAQIDQWTAKRNARRNRRDWLRSRLLGHLVATGRDKVLTATGRVIAVQANGGLVPLVLHNENTDLIPVEFLINKPVVDKAKVRQKLEAGEVLEFASLGERGRSLRIR